MNAGDHGHLSDATASDETAAAADCDTLSLGIGVAAVLVVTTVCCRIASLCKLSATLFDRDI